MWVAASARGRQEPAGPRAPGVRRRQPELIAWREGHCLPYGEGISFWALGEVLKAQAGILEFDDPATAAARLAETVAAAVQEPAERQWLETRLAPLLGLALLGLGRCATRLGRPSARAPLDEAAELFGRLRAPGLLAETGRWRLQPLL